MVIIAFILAAIVPPVAAAEKLVASGWEFDGAPCLWVISMGDKVIVKGLKANVDLNFNDLFDELNFER